MNKNIILAVSIIVPVSAILFSHTHKYLSDSFIPNLMLKNIEVLAQEEEENGSQYQRTERKAQQEITYWGNGINLCETWVDVITICEGKGRIECKEDISIEDYDVTFTES